MRSVLTVAAPALAILGATAAADPLPHDPMWSVEARAGFGVAIGGGAGMSHVRASPLTVELGGALAVVDAPRIFATGGLVIEAGDRTAAGASAGVRLDPDTYGLRFGAGLVYLAAPYTLWGPSASVGACRRTGRAVAVCLDAQANLYVGGSDLADSMTVSQVQLVLGIAVDGR